MIDVERLQSYLHWSAGLHRHVVEALPFALYFSPQDERVFFNYAIPLQSAGGNLDRELYDVTAEFLARGRRPSFEYLEDFAPDLGSALQRVGLVETSRETVMLCAPDIFRPAPRVPGLEIHVLDENSPADLLRACISTTERGFDPERLVVPTRSEVDDFRARLVTARAFLGLLDGVPAGTAVFTAPHEGLSEVAGVATLPEFRRRGIATAVTARATETAFASGVDTVFLSTVDEGAARVYRRLGFAPFTAKLAYGEQI